MLKERGDEGKGKDAGEGDVFVVWVLGRQRLVWVARLLSGLVVVLGIIEERRHHEAGIHHVSVMSSS